MEIKDIKWTKWIAIGVGGLLGLSHLGMIGIIANKKPESKFPQLNIPVSEYSSYSVQANEEGYAINYRANDPLVMQTTKEIEGKGGLFSGKPTTKIVKQYTMDGAEHHDGPVSTRSAWIDPSGLTVMVKRSLVPKQLSASKHEVVVKEQEEWSAVALVLLLVLVSPLYLLLVGFWQVLRR